MSASGRVIKSLVEIIDWEPLGSGSLAPKGAWVEQGRRLGIPDRRGLRDGKEVVYERKRVSGNAFRTKTEPRRKSGGQGFRGVKIIRKRQKREEGTRKVGIREEKV